MKLWMRPCVAKIMLLAVLTSACNARAEPTLSPADVATRLAQIPTAAALNPTNAAPPQAPSPTSAPAPTQAPTESVPPTSQAALGEFGEYTVQSGDTLSSIAFSFKVSMAAIQIANNLGESQIVKIGQALKIPQNKLSPDENVLWVVVAVKPGETLGGICQRYGVNLDDAVRVNKLRDASDIRAGQELIMPINAPAAFVQPEPIAQTVPTELPPTLAPALAQNSEAAIVEIIPILPIAPIATLTEIPEATPEPAVAQVQRIEPQANAAIAPPSSNQPHDIEAMRSQVLALYNQARAAEGVAPLTLSSALQQAAQLHAQDCAQRGFGSHTGSDGANTQTRVSRAGYTGRIWGENWAWARSIDRAFEMWFTEEFPDGPHRHNIMSARYAEVGFGIVPSNGGFYFIADFGAP